MPERPNEGDWSISFQEFLYNQIAVILGTTTGTPPVLIWASSQGISFPYTREISTVLIVVSISIFLGWIAGLLIDSNNEQKSISISKSVDTTDDIWKTEYQELGEEIRYRDSIIINASYFSLAVLALLANLLRVAPIDLVPAVATLGMYVAFAFAVVVEQKIIERDVMETRREDIEKSSSGIFASQTAISVSSSKRFFYPFNLSRHAIDFHRFILFLWIIAYIVTNMDQVWNLL
jgi:hypothetical protein